MTTLIQQARASSALKVLFDFRGGVLTDQSGNDVTLTVPANAVLNSHGLKCTTTTASFPLDLSGTQNIGVFCLLDNLQWDVLQYVYSLTSAVTNDDAFGAIQNTGGGGNFQFTFELGGALTTAYAARPARANHTFLTFHVDRRLSHRAVVPYQFGIREVSPSHIDNTDNDGTGFADDTIYLCGRGSASNMNKARMQVFGIVDFTNLQWNATDQARLYSEIHDGLTI